MYKLHVYMDLLDGADALYPCCRLIGGMDEGDLLRAQ